MVSLSNTDLRSMDSGLGGFSTNLESSLQSELELLLQARRNRQVNDREKELNIYRYGSAPPTVEGSLSAVGGLFQESSSRDGHIWTNSDNNAITSEDEIRSHPAYLQYYYSHGNVNPRLPPPALSKEDWRVAQRFQAGGSSFGGIRDLRKNVIVEDDNDSSLFSMQPGGSRLSTEKAENDLMELRMANRKPSPQWPERAVDRLSGLPSPGLGTRRKSFADILQEGVNGSAPLLDQPSRPQSQNSLADMVGRIGSSDSHIMGLSRDRAESMEGLLSGTNSSSFPRIPSPGIINSHASASIGSSLSRNRTPEPQFTGRPPSSGSPLVDSRGLPKERKNAIGSNIQNGSSLGITGIDDVAASLSGLSFTENRHSSERNLQQSQQLDFASAMLNGHSRNMQQLIDESNAKNLAGSSNLARKTRHLSDLGAFETHTMGQVNFPRRTASSANLHSQMNSASYENLKAYDNHYQGAEIPNMDFSSHLLAAGMSGERNLSSNLNSYLAGSAFTGNGINPELLDPAYVQYLQRNSDLAAQALAVNNLSYLRDQYLGGDYDLQKAYVEASLARQQQYGHNLGKSTLPNQINQGNLKHGFPLQHPRYTRANMGIPSVGYGNAVLHDEQIAHFASMMRSPEASIGPWSSNSGLNPEGKFSSSLLDEFKNNKTRLFELSDIYNHVVEFSTDQYGSRFIQQKLETATEEEKNQIFSEILPHARSLMTDVFGNYVIQKFFEHGTASQRKELANQLTGYVLPLSLQMYGCRVIQKALEVIDVEQKVQMVAELDGSVKKCVRDQNGNHVIQKCIECVPQNQIQFIISSFYGQVATLSMHPYGCRVIQRVLEYCDDPRTQEIIMDEIMQSVNSLAQDQYGNYVIQHILEHGKPHERSAIVSMLSGQVVRMSQQKYASNVVEKCLTFGTPEERQLLIKEIIGFTDENEPLQAMMRDPFGNYVVQKVLETCDNRSLEYILSRIRVHLNNLKRYTYGKHIVSRVEKLIATGEQRMVMSSSQSSGGN